MQQKILDRFKIKLDAHGEEHEQVNCVVTETDVVLELQPSIKIPISSIKRCEISYYIPSYYSYPPQVQKPLSDDATLTFLDDLNKKHQLKFKLIGGGGHTLKQLIDKQIAEQKILSNWAEIAQRSQLLNRESTFKDFLQSVKELFRDKTRDRICAGLRMLGIDAQMSLRGRIEERVCGGNSLGIIDIHNSPIDWVNIRKETRGSGENRNVYHFIEYGIPDNRLGSNSDLIGIKTVSIKTIPLVGRIKDIRWEGEELNLGIISRLNDDISLKYPIMKSHDLSITANGKYGCWVISTETRKIPTADLWSCYEAIAQHLRAEWLT
jgi:hypothetical protein